ncbi:hypothetical protein FD754_008680, partial [Muntiacus muntjak]
IEYIERQMERNIYEDKLAFLNLEKNDGHRSGLAPLCCIKKISEHLTKGHSRNLEEAVLVDSLPLSDQGSPCTRSPNLQKRNKSVSKGKSVNLICLGFLKSLSDFPFSAIFENNVREQCKTRVRGQVVCSLVIQLSHPYMTTGKALTRWTFVGKDMSLLFNMLSRLVITFLLGARHFQYKLYFQRFLHSGEILLEGETWHMVSELLTVHTSFHSQKNIALGGNAYHQAQRGKIFLKTWHGSLQMRSERQRVFEGESGRIGRSALQILIAPSLTLTVLLCLETNCQMRTLDSGIGTFPLPDSGTRAAGRYIRQADSPEDTDPILSLQPALCAASSMRAQTLEREVPSSADSQGSADNAIVHSTSDPIMTARGMRPLQSLLPKPASSGKINSQMQSEAEPRSQNCSSFEYVENTMVSKPLPAWEGDGAAAETQDKVPRMCAHSASGGSDSDSDPDYGNNGFGAGRGKLVKAMKSTTPGCVSTSLRSYILVPRLS